MVSKKEALILGVLAIGGVAVASSIAGGGDGVVKPQQRYGTIMGSQTPQTAPTIYNLPAAAAVTFPAAPTFDIGRFLAPQEEPARGTAGVSAAPKKYVSTGTVALGYEGYVTPVVPTPVSPGYIPGVTTFVPYMEPAYIPSPIKPPGVSYGGGGGRRTYTKTAAKAPSAKAPATTKKKIVSTISRAPIARFTGG